MKKWFFLLLLVVATAAFSADQVIRYNESMVGAGHPTLSDTLNRALLIEHNADGTHKASISGSPSSYPYDNITDRPTINGVTVEGVVLDNASNYPTLNQDTTGTAAALAANGANCAAGQAPLGVGASGAVEGCWTPFANVVEDTTPQLGGNLDLNGFQLDNVTRVVLEYIKNLTGDAQGQIEGKQTTTPAISDLSDGSLAAPLRFEDDVYAKFGTDNDFTLRYKAADGTLVVALDNGSAMCTYSKTGGLACTGEITGSQINTTAADGERFIDASNSTAPTPAASSYPMYYDTAMHKFRLWNGSSWDNVALESP